MVDRAALLMRREDTPDGRMILRHDARTMSRVLSAIAIALAALIGYEVISGRRFGDGLGGAIAGLVLTTFAAIVSYEVSWFELDPVAGRLSYRRRWGFRSYAGTVPFAEIENVLAESSPRSRSVANRRLVFQLRNGTLLPFTASYAPDNGEAINFAASVRAMLGHMPLPTPADRARVLARAGRTMDAVRELRSGTGLSLDEAMRQVKELARERDAESG